MRSASHRNSLSDWQNVSGLERITALFCIDLLPGLLS